MLKTNAIIATVAVIGGVGIAGLSVNQYQLQQKVASVEKHPVIIQKELIMATPSATITPTYILKAIPTKEVTKTIK